VLAAASISKGLVVAGTASDTLPTSQGNGAGASPLEFRPRTVIVASLLAAALIATAGSLSDISLGDENTHVRQARAYAESGYRVPCDPLSSSIDDRAPKPFSAGPAWHSGLAILWRLTGSPSQIVAQIYQAGFYLLLLLSVYFGVRQIWDNSAASWTWLLMVTMPMVCAYSILLLQDVPGIAVSALGLFLLFRRNFLWAGVCLGVAYLIKMNMLSYAPWAVVFAAWWAGGTWKRRVVSATMVAIPVVIALGYDIVWWRLPHYGGITGKIENTSGLSAAALDVLQQRWHNFDRLAPNTIDEPLSILKNIGIPILAASFFAVFLAWRGVATWLWACFGLAVMGFVFVFALRDNLQVRYLFPAFLIWVLLCGQALREWRLPYSLKALVVAGCLAQGLATGVYVYHCRHIPACEKAAYAWIRENTPPEARILFPDPALTNQTGRAYLWGHLNPVRFLSDASDDARQEILTYFHVSYVAVSPRFVYDRQQQGQRIGGYPKDFVDKAPTLPYLEKVYENDGFLIFKFHPCHTVNAWRTIPLAAFHPRVALTKTEGG
jgi:hypothetical protein